MKAVIRITFVSLFLALAGSQNLSAQNDRSALTYLPSDSLSFIDSDISNWHLFPLTEYGELTAQPVTADARSLRKDTKRWKKWVSSHPVNMVGGTGSEETAQQGDAAVEMTQLAARMFLHTGESSYIDLMERALFNALPASVLQEKRIAPKTAVRAAQTILNAAGTVYALRGDSVFLNFYLNSFAHIPMQGFDFTIDQVTGMPFTGRFKLRLGRVPQGGRTFAICLRLPEWLPERPEIFVNGHDTEYEVIHGFAVIHRKWLNRDEVYLNFPEDPTFRFNAADGTTSLQTRMLVDAFPRLGDIPAGNPQLQAITDIYDDGMTAHPHYKVVFRAQDQSYELIASPYLDVPAHARRIWVKKSE